MTPNPDETAAGPHEDDELDPEVLRLEQLHGPPDDGFASDEEWEAEIKRRIDDFDSGREPGVPWAEVRRKLQEDLDGHAG